MITNNRRFSHFFLDIFFFVIISFIPLHFSSAESVEILETPSFLPVVDISQFQKGQYWVWTYYEKGDFNKPYSYEKYQVESVKDSVVEIILSSQIVSNGDTEFKPRTKFKGDLNKCKNTYRDRNPPVRTGWLVRGYYRSGDRWIEIEEGLKTAVFEEKFNCNPHIFELNQHRRFRTKFTELDHPKLGEVNVFEHLDNLKNYPSTQYFQSLLNQNGGGHSLNGVAIFKEFSPNSPQYYVMRLEEWGNNFNP